MRAEFASAGLTAGQLNAIVKKLGGHDMALRFLRGELSVSEPTLSWREEDGVISFSVTSPTHEELFASLDPKIQMTSSYGDAWIARLESKGFRMNDEAEVVLRSPYFKPTSGVTTEVVVFKDCYFQDVARITQRIRVHAKAFRTPDKRKLVVSNAELACLMREKFTDEEILKMGLRYIIAMHEPVIDITGTPFLLYVHCGYGGRWLNACRTKPNDSWGRGFGFAFAVSPQ